MWKFGEKRVNMDRKKSNLFYTNWGRRGIMVVESSAKW